MTITRRGFLLGGGAAAGALLLERPAAAVPRHARPQSQGNGQSLRTDPFTLGVASGDPLPTSVVLWTRLAPRPLEGGGMSQRPVVVRWQVSTDESFRGRSVVRHGVTMAEPGLGHSVHVDVDGLQPGREYWYRFRTSRWVSPVGRTKTAPAPGASPASLAFAFASCQHWETGYYTAYRDMAEQDLDLVVHLGDYIYENGPKNPASKPGTPPERLHNSPEVYTVEDYRNRYALYRSDPNLQLVHQRFPWVVTWDDHEVDNDHAGLVSDKPADQPIFAERRASAYQAYYEHMPIRRRPSGPNLELYRNLRFGDLLNLHVLDTRQYRSDQPCGGEVSNCDERLAESQTMTGAAQERWLLEGLAASGARWDALAQQTIFAELDFNVFQPGSVGAAGLFNPDQWDGYAAQRRRIADLLAGEGAPRNTVVLTGDFHASFVNDVKVDYDDPGSPTVATEFVGTSISSDFGDEALIGLAETVTSSPDNAHIKDFDGRHRGYVACRVDRDRWTSDYRIVSTTAQPTATASTRAVWVVEDGRPGAVPA